MCSRNRLIEAWRMGERKGEKQADDSWRKCKNANHMCARKWKANTLSMCGTSGHRLKLLLPPFLGHIEKRSTVSPLYMKGKKRKKRKRLVICICAIRILSMANFFFAIYWSPPPPSFPTTTIMTATVATDCFIFSPSFNVKKPIKKLFSVLWHPIAWILFKVTMWKTIQSPASPFFPSMVFVFDINCRCWLLQQIFCSSCLRKWFHPRNSQISCLNFPFL